VAIALCRIQAASGDGHSGVGTRSPEAESAFEGNAAGEPGSRRGRRRWARASAGRIIHKGSVPPSSGPLASRPVMSDSSRRGRHAALVRHNLSDMATVRITAPCRPRGTDA
jgi:hypothetical protein